MSHVCWSSKYNDDIVFEPKGTHTLLNSPANASYIASQSPYRVLASVCVSCARSCFEVEPPPHREGCAYAWYVHGAIALCRLLTQESRKKFPHQICACKSRLLYGMVLPYHRTTFKMLLKPELKNSLYRCWMAYLYVCPPWAADASATFVVSMAGV